MSPSTAPDPGLLRRFKTIVVEGPIGVGKTTLAHRLAEHLGADLLLERAEDNPFLERFYDDMPGFALQTQLFFLFQRVKQMQSVVQPGMFASGLVSDFLFAKDALFARLNLSDDEYRLYTQMYAQVEPQVAAPDLVVWLQASPGTLLQRIHRRGAAMEQRITSAYLQRLCDAYVEYFHAFEAAPVFAVGTEHFNPVDHDADFATLLERLALFRGRREFFNSHVELRLS
jgi:deoxyadenosine/deoxycytidine kinase